MVFMEQTRMKFLIDPKTEETLLITESSKEKGHEDDLRTAKQKMDEIREENERLKLRLSQVMEDYHSLKKQFSDEDEDKQAKKSTASSDEDDDESEFVSLSLGRSSVNYSNMDEKMKRKKEENPDDGLELGLDCKFHSDNSTDKTSSKNETDEKGNKEASTPSRDGSPKNSRSGDDEILQQAPSLKKPRVSVRAFCNTQTMNDGCQWRKYGQKVAKGNPCPRAYYRCTIGSACPVRKQVQRCVDDMTILTTTYEGTHNHPLPPAATNMASTTSAAAAMLNCKSSSSSTSSSAQPSGLSTTTPGFNLASSPHFPNITISTTQSHPTVVLDLTVPNHYGTNPASRHTTKFSPSSLFSNALPSSTSLNFSSSNSLFEPSNALLKDMPTIPYSQPFVFNSYNNGMTPSRLTTNNDSIAAATKMITNNPSFQSALAAAITSFVGSKVQGRNSGLDFQLSFSRPSENNANLGRIPGFFSK